MVTKTSDKLKFRYLFYLFNSNIGHIVYKKICWINLNKMYRLLGKFYFMILIHIFYHSFNTNHKQ